MRFKTWYILSEAEQPLRKQQQAEVEKLYQNVLKALSLGGAKNITNMSLSDVVDDDSGPDSPPIKKGAMVVKSKLEKSGVFNQMMKMPTLMQRAGDVQNYLQKIANDQQVGPKDTLGELLNKMFGPNAVELYGKGLWKTAPSPTPHAPQNSAQATPDAVAPPMSNDLPPPGGAPPAMPGEPPPGGAPPMGGAPPPGTAPPGMAPMPGMPPPNQALQSPGGKTPPLPPGGMF
jgi:hypothetical protein